MYKIFIFAGTTEGRKLTEFLSGFGVMVYAFTATEYGESLIGKRDHVVLSHQKLSCEEMEEQIRREKPDLVLDATHPYADLVTENISLACKNTHTELVRLIRDGFDCDGEGIIYVDSAKQAAKFLSRTEGNVFLTTGSKALMEYTAVPDYEKRMFVRVLSMPDVVKYCANLGFQGSHLICMQGPFSKELNTAMLKQYDCSWMVTKESGREGGFLEKQEAAREAGAKLLVIGRPKQEQGVTYKECRKMLQKRFAIPYSPDITLVGVGTGSVDTMTVEAIRVCQRAELLIGAGRPLETVIKAAGERKKADRYEEYRGEYIVSYIKEHPFYDHIVIALSGDPGFYSGAKTLYKVLGNETEWKLKTVCGISSLAYFMSRLQLSWEDAVFASCHGQKARLISRIAANKKVFAILGNGKEVRQLAEELLEYGLDDVTIHVGERLSYPEEKIRSGFPSDFLFCETDVLSVLCVENPHPKSFLAVHGIKDEQFNRGKVPMTKEEIRSISLSKLRLTKDAVCYDIGAGTGSVSVEMAIRAYEGRVYAVEKKPEAAELLYENRKKFRVDNMTVVEGTAPEVLHSLEVPTHVFIGGSSGNLTKILKTVLKKNPQVCLVINCITLETLSEAVTALKCLPVTDPDVVNVFVGKAKSAGDYHLMMGENPVFIISCEGTSEVCHED